MLYDQRSKLSTYASGLLSEGRMVFSADEAGEALGIGRGAFLDAAERLQRRKTPHQTAAGILCRGTAAVRSLGRPASELLHR